MTDVAGSFNWFRSRAALSKQQPIPTISGQSNSATTSHDKEFLRASATNLRIATDIPQATQKQNTWKASAREGLQSIVKFFTRIFCCFSTKKSEGIGGFYAGQNGTDAQVRLLSESTAASARRASTGSQAESQESDLDSNSDNNATISGAAGNIVASGYFRSAALLEAAYLDNKEVSSRFREPYLHPHL